MTHNSILFQLDSQATFMHRSGSNFDQHNFLYKWVAKDIEIRFSEITRSFSSVLLGGNYAGQFLSGLFTKPVLSKQTTPESLSAQTEQFESIISMGELHAVNDLPGMLIQFRRALKPDGVFVAAFVGGETLNELRESLLQGEITVTGGASPRVYPFVDKQQMAGLMQRAGFALPVVDSELIKVAYRDIYHLMSDIRGMGEQNSLSARTRNFTKSKVFFEADKYYKDKFMGDDSRITATFEILFVIGWAPHHSQQQPAKRGSGQVSMTEIL